MKYLANIFKKIHTYCSQSAYIEYLRDCGVSIGKNFLISGGHRSVLIDLTRPSLITIGDNVCVNRNFTLMTHDFVSGVFREQFHDFLPSSGVVHIGNNVRFGVNCTVLKGVHIGDNCYIGAGSVVSSDIPAGSIANGVPCRVVGTIDAFYRFREKECLEEAFIYAKSIETRFRRRPIVDDFREEFVFFVDKTNIQDYPTLPIKQQLGEAYDYWLEHHKAPYSGLDEFLRAALYNGQPDNKSTIMSDRSLHYKNYEESVYREIFIKTLGVKEIDVESSIYKETEGWDSVGMMSLIAETENTFSIRLRPEDFMRFKSYRDGIRVLKDYGIIIQVPKKNNDLPNGDFFDFSKYFNNIAVQTLDNSYSYADLDAMSYELGERMASHKLAVLLARNTIGSVASYVSCIKNNVPVAILDAHKDVVVVKELIKRYHPEYLIVPKENASLYQGDVVQSVYDYLVLQIEKTNYPVSNDLALLLTTSGSTGSPKFVRLSKNNIHSNAMSIASYLNLNQYERPITSLPMYYSYGISIINSHLIVGGCILLTQESVVSSAFWTFAKKGEATSFAGVPYTYDMLKQMRFFEMDLPKLKTLTQAGGKMSPESVELFAANCKEQGKRFFVMYGQTEASPRISYVPPEKILDKSDSIGIAIPGGKMSVGEDGELIFMGDNVFMGYAESFHDLGKEDENKGVLYTGDIVRKDEDGFFYIIGRKKRFVKLYGNRVSLDNLESMLSSKFGKTICVGKDDRVTIYTEDSTVNFADVVSYVSKQTNINANAFTAQYIEAFPYNESGKIEYSKLEVL